MEILEINKLVDKLGAATNQS